MVRMYHRRGGILSGRGRSSGGAGGGSGGAGSVLGSLGPRDGPPMPRPGFGRSGMMQSGPGMPYSRPPLLPQGPPGRDAAFRNAGLLQMTMSKRPGGPDLSWDSKRQRIDMGRQSDMSFNRRGGRGHDGGTEYDPSRPTDDSAQGGSRKSEKEHFCRICKISCWDEESMERHMSGKKHQAVVENMRRSGPGIRSGGSGAGGNREYCSTCGRWIEGSFESHKGSREHLDKMRKKGSGSGPGPKASPGPPSVGDTKGKPDGESANTEKSDDKAPAAVAAKEAEIDGKAEKEKNEQAEIPKNANGKDVCPPEEEEQEGTVEDEIVIPEYEEKVSFGREYVVPVTGYFCRLCSKFYSSDTTAYDVHCRSRVHYDKYVVALEALRGKKNGEDAAAADAKADSAPMGRSRGRGIRRGNSKA